LSSGLLHEDEVMVARVAAEYGAPVIPVSLGPVVLFASHSIVRSLLLSLVLATAVVVLVLLVLVLVAGVEVLVVLLLVVVVVVLVVLLLLLSPLTCCVCSSLNLFL